MAQKGFTIERYTPEKKAEWDAFVDQSRNGTFLFRRDYMDYHAHRFSDHSLLFYKKRNQIYALLPAHAEGETFCSHKGLTYGGLVMGEQVTAADTLELFRTLNDYLRKAGFRTVFYRPIPHIYHRLPSEEDLYALFWQCHARLSLRNIGTTISIQQRTLWRKDHRRRLNDAHRNGIRVVANDTLEEFWPMLEENLRQRFQAQPVHTLEEISLLKQRFPDNIIQYNAYLGDELVGGLTFYLTPQVLHGQYSATNDKGKQTGAMEAIYEQVLFHDYAHMPYLDFGSSTEQQGAWLNQGLIGHKEGYGGRAICYDTYEWNIEHRLL